MTEPEAAKPAETKTAPTTPTSNGAVEPAKPKEEPKESPIVTGLLDRVKKLEDERDRLERELDLRTTKPNVFKPKVHAWLKKPAGKQSE